MAFHSWRADSYSGWSGADDVALELAVQLLGDAGPQVVVDERAAGLVIPSAHAVTAAPDLIRRMAARVAATALR